MTHIRDALPELRLKVNSTLTSSRNEMIALGDEKETPNKGALLLSIINTFVHNYCNTIDGRLSSVSATEELYGGARINYIFNDVFGNYIDGIDGKGGFTEEAIQITMMNATGAKSSLFVPEESFEQLARLQIRILEDPSLRCVDLVHDELQRIVNCIEISELKRYNNLREKKIIEVVNNLLRDYKRPTKEMIRNLISIEIAHINTSHPDFIGGGDAIAKIMKNRAKEQLQQQHPTSARDSSAPPQQQLQRQQQSRNQPEEKKSSFFGFFKENNKKKEEEVVVMEKVPQRVVPKPARARSENDDFQIELIETLLRSYFKIVRKNIKDRVPKSIMHFMVNASKDKVQNELVKQLYKEDMFGSLLEESDDIAQRRENLRETINVLTAAQRHLNEIIDYRL